MSTLVGERDRLLEDAPTRYLVSTVGKSLVLSANSPVFAVSTSGSGLPVQVQISASLLNIDGPVVFAAPAGTTVSVAGRVATLKFADMGADQVTISASVYDADSNATYLASQTISKVFDGVNGAAGRQTALVYAYIRSATAPAGNPGTVTFDFTTGKISLPAGDALANGYSKSIPAGTDPLYVAVASASGTTSTDGIASAEWAAAVMLAENGRPGVNGANGTNGRDGRDGVNGSNGADGAPGLNAATVSIYQRSDDITPPARPSALTTYVFGTGLLSGLDGGWSQAVPVGAGRYLFISTATAASTSVTDTITSGEWAAVRILSQNGQRGTVTISAGGHPTWTDAGAAGEIANAGYGAPIDRDIVTLYSGSSVVTKFFQGGQWYAMTMKVDGNLLVTGSVGAGALNVAVISAISANLGNITAGDLYGTTLHGGSGYPTNAYGWPTNGGGGYHLSATGLLIGNPAIGGYVELNSSGYVGIPGLEIVPGKAARFSGNLDAAGGTFSGNVVSGIAPGFRIEQGPDDPVYAMWAGSGAKTDANAIFFLKRSGAGYFGGALSAGILRTSVTNPTFGPNEQVVSGPFGSNGGTITVIGSIALYSQEKSNRYTFSHGSGTTGCSFTLYRKLGTDPEVAVHTFYLPGTEDFRNFNSYDPEGIGSESTATRNISGSFTFTDPVQSNLNRTYRLVAAVTLQNFTYTKKVGAPTGLDITGGYDQRTTIVTME